VKSNNLRGNSLFKDNKNLIGLNSGFSHETSFLILLRVNNQQRFYSISQALNVPIYSLQLDSSDVYTKYIRNYFLEYRRYNLVSLDHLRGMKARMATK